MAFTLAEVLITLGIIGIVAALTMPSLVQNYKKQEASVRLKKFNSIMQNALALSVNDNGPVEEWSRRDNINDEDGNNLPDDNFNESKRYFLTYFAPYLKYSKIVQDENEKKSNILVYFHDGSSFSAWNGGCFNIIYDINGLGKPNELGVDKFEFYFCEDPMRRETYMGGNYPFGVYQMDKGIDRDEAIQNCKDTQSCELLLYMDNWEFKKDYPIKF